jgi:hypothetical protein
MKVIDISFLHPAKFEPLELRAIAAAPSTLKVPGDADAVSAVRIAELNQKRVILAMNPKKPAEVTGVLSLDWLKRQISRHKGIDARLLSDTLVMLADDPSEKQTNFHHEWVNLERPPLMWCEKGQHYAILPCEEHPG